MLFDMGGTRDVIQFAQRNGGVFSMQEAIALGLPKSTLQRRVDQGIFVRVAKGMLALPGTSTRPDLAMRAALRLLNGVVSHQSAARIHGFEAIPISPPTITVSHRSNYSFPGVVVHQSTDLLAEHVQEVEGLFVTTPARTLVDLAKVFGPQRLERVVQHALLTGKVDVGELVELVAALSRRGKRGTKALRTIIDELVLGVAATDTQLERLLFRLIDDAGLPRPTRQFNAPWLKSLNGRVDFAYEAEKIVIEADSRRWHLQFDAFEVDKIRDNAAQLAGWIVLRITWRMIKDQPTQVIHTIRTALEVRSGPVHSRED
ncbi:MAG TPA: type IV toxin-antitoxin system AbiEi family antitoxin domain-containing protein [Acidimicrobiia bacterium]|nr:type IV toxin-antitoxin system AbiEi family antitoxin domain-containing protein [Acidimicrobiia bacterium]